MTKLPCLLILTALIATLTPAVLTAQENLARIQINQEEIDREWNRYILLDRNRGIEHGEGELAALKEDVRKGYIMRQLLLSLASYRNITVTGEEVDDVLSQTRGDYPEADWEAMLKGQLFTPESFRQSLEESLIIDRVLKAEVTDRILIGDDEIESYYKAHESSYTTDYGVIPLREVKGLIREILKAEKSREETARFMDDLYSRTMFVEGDPTPIQ